MKRYSCIAGYIPGSNYVEGGATKVYTVCNHAVCPSVRLSVKSISRRSLKTKR